jgi:phosphate transport system permease protein
MAHPALLGRATRWLLAHGKVDAYAAEGRASANPPATGIQRAPTGSWAGSTRWSRACADLRLNRNLLGNGDSRDPSRPASGGAVMGSLTRCWSRCCCRSRSAWPRRLPRGVRPRNRWTDLIEVNINNLAAVPSIVFGLLGLAVFISLFGMPRSAPLVGGLVLTLLTCPPSSSPRARR